MYALDYVYDIAICADIHLISFDMVYCVIICNPVLNFIEAKQSLLCVGNSSYQQLLRLQFFVFIDTSSSIMHKQILKFLFEAAEQKHSIRKLSNTLVAGNISMLILFLIFASIISYICCCICVGYSKLHSNK